MSNNSSELSLQTLINENRTTNNTVTIEGTVDTGFEQVALEECLELFGSSVKCCRNRGRIFFNVIANTSNIDKLRKMRSVDNLYQIILADKIEFDGKDKEVDLTKVKDIVNGYDFKHDFPIWETCMAFKGISFPTSEQAKKADEIRKILKEKAELANKNQEDGETKVNDEKQIDLKVIENLDSIGDTLKTENLKTDDISHDKEKLDHNLQDDEKLELNVLKFRATCNRVGKHSFSSMEAARDFGGQLHDNYMWLVDLKNFDLEVVLNICDSDIYIGLALTKESMHKRNITHFGPTTLRATLCYNLLRLAQPKAGDVVIDPLCGGGSIPIECSLAFPNTFNICGDIHEKAVNRTACNLNHLENLYKKSLPLDAFQWDATKLPLRSGSVDVITSDLPFGKRSGRKIDNVPLYRRALDELTRVVTPTSGRAVLMTQDRKAFIKVFSSSFALFWTNPIRFKINLGGLDAAVFVLKRTANVRK